jgi:N-acetylmuramoyl-L-alanine amidase
MGIIIHHSDTPGMVHGQYVGAALIDRSHQRRGFAIRYRGKVYHIGYHYVIREDGVIEPGRPEHCLGAHATRHNDYLGICLVGDFSTAHNPHFWVPSRPTPPQLHALVWLCRRLMAKYQIPPDHVIRHCDVRDTVCPGDRFPYAWLQRQLTSGGDRRLAEVRAKVKGQHGVHPLARVPETRRKTG